MSNSHLFLKSTFPRAPLQNGVGRYVCQLQRITIKYCKTSGCSKGVRDFLENRLLEFSKAYPGVVVYVKPRRHRMPVVVGEYLNGERHWMCARNFTEEELIKWIDLMRTQNENSSAVRRRKHWQTNWPSIQGVWTPFTHQHPEMTDAKFPDQKFSAPIDQQPTATELLLEMFKKQQLTEEHKSLENVEKVETVGSQ